MNSIAQQLLESLVIGTVIDFYSPYLQKNGRKKLAEAVKSQIGSESEDFDTARQRAEEELLRIIEIINNLLDNIISPNRDYVDRRLIKLNQQRQKLENRLHELDGLILSKAEMNTITADAMKFIYGLQFTLSEGLPQEKLVALRQCVERIYINKPAGQIKLALRQIPAGNLQATDELNCPFDSAFINTNYTYP